MGGQGDGGTGIKGGEAGIEGAGSGGGERGLRGREAGIEGAGTRERAGSVYKSLKDRGMYKILMRNLPTRNHFVCFVKY